MIRLFGILAFVLLLGTSSFAADRPEDAQFREKIAAFIDSWHDDAAHSRMAYFDKMTPDGVFIGTDKTERWTRDEFIVWAKPAFAKPSAWTFHARNRHIDFTADKSVIWFDEQLDGALGLCQASGVIRNGKDGMKIQHYQLSIAVPNDALPKIRDEIAAFERSR